MKIHQSCFQIIRGEKDN